MSFPVLRRCWLSWEKQWFINRGRSGRSAHFSVLVNKLTNHAENTSIFSFSPATVSKSSSAICESAESRWISWFCPTHTLLICFNPSAGNSSISAFPVLWGYLWTERLRVIQGLFQGHSVGHRWFRGQEDVQVWCFLGHVLGFFTSHCVVLWRDVTIYLYVIYVQLPVLHSIFCFI